MPHNLEAEKYILGCLMIEPSLVGEILNRIGPNDFYVEANRNIMTAITNLYSESKSVEHMQVLEEMKRIHVYDTSGGYEYILELVESVPAVVDINSYLEILEEKTLLRELYNVSKRIEDKVTKGEDTFSTIGELAETEIMRVINQKRTGDVKRISRFTNLVLDIIEGNKNKDGRLLGLDTGFDELNKLTFGFQKGELIILAARPAVGKSAFALNIAANACKNANASVAFFSLEMGIDQLTMRLFSSFSGLSLTKIRSGKLTSNEFTTLLASKATVDKFSLYLDETSNNNLNDIKSKCLKLKREGKLDLVIIDYLQLIAVSDKGNRTEEVGKISRGLKTMARELEVPILALSQLSRSVEQTGDKRPMLSHLRESGSIEQDADIVMFLHRDQAPQEGDASKKVKNHKTELIIAKNRQGATDSVFLMFKGAQSMFMSMESEQSKED